MSEVILGFLFVEIGGLTLLSNMDEEMGVDSLLLGGFIQGINEFSNILGDFGLRTIIFHERKLTILRIFSDKLLVLVTAADAMEWPLFQLLEEFRFDLEQDQGIIKEIETFQATKEQNFPILEYRIRGLLHEINRSTDKIQQPGIRALYVEDDPDQYDLLETLLAEYFPGLILESAESVEEMAKKLKQGTYDILFLDLMMQGDSVVPLIPEIQPKYRNMEIIVISGQTDVRIALQVASYDVPYVIKGSHFVPDLQKTLHNLTRLVLVTKEKELLKNVVFDEDNFPLVVYRMEGSKGVEILHKDFEEFPEPLNQPIEDFLQFLAIFTFAATGQGSMYHQGLFVLPAMSSKMYQILVYSFSLADPMSSDERTKEACYVQFVLFFPKRMSSVLPNLKTMDHLFSSQLKEFKSVQELSEEVIRKIKSKIIEGIQGSLTNCIRDLPT